MPEALRMNSTSFKGVSGVVRLVGSWEFAVGLQCSWSGARLPHPLGGQATLTAEVLADAGPLT